MNNWSTETKIAYIMEVEGICYAEAKAILNEYLKPNNN